MSCAHLTAIARKKPSAPMMFLWGINRLQPDRVILDYGCGKGKDVEWMKSIGRMAFGYDPHYAPNTIQNGMANCYDIITCNFVLNVIESSNERESTILHIKGLLRHGGHAYVAIRADKAKLNGYTKRGTFQTYVDMLPYGFKLLHKGSGYELYEYIKP